MERFRFAIHDGRGRPYEQVRDHITALIRRGSLLPGDRLPPVRSCAEQLDLAPNTVARAYRELDDEALARAAVAYLRRAEQLGFDRAAAARALRRSG